MKENSNNKNFRFKQFSVDDRGCGMPVSTDGVILGAWADIPDNLSATKSSLLDIGTGTGLLALMMAQRFSGIRITALDIDKHAAETARLNIAASQWHSRIDVVEQDVTRWQAPASFDAIICNPPYFTSGETASDPRRAVARHTGSLCHTALLAAIAHLLSPQGVANLVLPAYEGMLLHKAAATAGLHCQRLLEVKTTEAKPVSRILLALGKTRVEACRRESLVIHHQGEYSEAFIALTRDFYLKM